MGDHRARDPEDGGDPDGSGSSGSRQQASDDPSNGQSSARLSDHEWNKDQRQESEVQRLDRNWTDLLQELRVTQTGVQLLTGFLLTLPFQSRFEQLSGFQQGVYLMTLGASVFATGFLIAPVALHRTLFRMHARAITVDLAHRWAQIGLGFLGVAIAGVVLLIFDVVLGRTAAIIATAVAALLLLILWVAVPQFQRRATREQNDADQNSTE